MAHINKGSQVYLPPTHTSTNEMNNACLLPSCRASLHFGCYLFPVPKRTGDWVGL